MKYTKTFTQKVLDLYPSNPFGIHEMVERGDPLVGRILDDSKGKDPEKNQLYAEWLDLSKKNIIGDERRNIHTRKRTFFKE